MYLYEILEEEAIRQGYEPEDLSFDELINVAGGVIFDFDYGIYNEDYKQVLEYKFFLRNFEKAIGAETVWSFKRSLASKLAEIIPKYNRLYELEEKQIDFFIGQLYEERFEKDTKSEQDVDSNTDSKNDSSSDSVTSDRNSQTTEAGDMSEECNRTESRSNNRVEGKTIDTGSTTDNRTEITKDRPESRNANSLDFASRSLGVTGKGTSKSDTASDTKSTDFTEGSHGVKRAGASFSDTDGSSSSTGNVKQSALGNIKRKDLISTNALENYILTRTNNNADGMIDRIMNYVVNIKDTDELVLLELDVLFSGVWF